MITYENSTSASPAGRQEDAEPFSLLVVDDSEPNRDALCRRLQRRGYGVTTAKDGTQALALLAEQRFDLVLLDVMMPGLNGLEVLQIIRETHPGTELPVIMATARDESSDIVRALELGASDYVTKPLDFAVVLARVRTHLSLKRSIQQILELEQQLSQRNAELEASNTRMQRDLEAAARIQSAFLPRTIPAIAGANFAWDFRPCQTLAGDFLNVCPLDDSHIAIYVLDVSGHGVGAALLSVTLSRILSPAGPDSLLLRDPSGSAEDRLVSPAEVAERLGQKFPWDSATEQFFTIVYGILDVKARRFRYVSAGHPGIAHLRRNSEPTLHQMAGFPIGLGAGYEERTLQLEPGDRLYLFSDGVTETRSLEGKFFGNTRLLETLGRGQTQSLSGSIALLLGDLHQWCGEAPFRDDISALAVEVA